MPARWRSSVETILPMNSLRDFLSRLDETGRLLDQVAPGWWPERSTSGAGTPDPLVAGQLSRATVVLLVSYFEGFLKDLADEAFDQLSGSSVPCYRLPEHLRGQLLLTHVRQLRSSSDPSEVWASVKSLVELGGALAGEGAASESMLPREETRRSMSSIDPVKINSLLKALGDVDLKAGPMSIYGERLKGLKQIRDNAVHGNERDLPPIAFGEVISAMDLLSSAAQALTDRVRELLAALAQPDSHRAPSAQQDHY